jgi:hypothetical protein
MKTTTTLNRYGMCTFAHTGHGVDKPIKYNDMLLVCVAMLEERLQWWICHNVTAAYLQFPIDKPSVHKSILDQGSGWETLAWSIERLCVQYTKPGEMDDESLSPTCQMEEQTDRLIMEHMRHQYRLEKVVEQNTASDYIRYDLQGQQIGRQQHKTARMYHNSILGSLSRNGKQKRPYSQGDNDFYVFGYKTDDKFYVWDIPEHEMIQHGMVSTETQKGRLAICLHFERKEIRGWSLNGNKYHAAMSLHGKRHDIGVFDTAAEATEAYHKAVAECEYQVRTRDASWTADFLTVHDLT